MFTIPQIEALLAEVKSDADFPQYIEAIKNLGVLSFDTYVADSHSEYHGAGNFRLVSDLKYPTMSTASEGQPSAFEQAIKIHQQGHADYPTFCRQAADAGVEKWRADISAMTCTYYDVAGNSMVAEPIPDVKQSR